MTPPRRILVTGGSGFVGRHLLHVLRQGLPGAAVLAAARLGEAGDGTLALDLGDPGSVARLVADAAPDAVIHLAAQAAVSDSFVDPAGTWRSNVDGTLWLAQALMRIAPAPLLLFASSAEVYGLSFQPGLPLDEDAPLRPANPYAASKAAAEIALSEMALRGLRVLRLRPFNHVGAGQSEGYVVAAFARQVARIEAGLQEPVLRTGALDRWRDFLDVRDVCGAYLAALRHAPALPNGAAVNIASGRARRIGDILDALLARSRRSIRVEPEAARFRPMDIAQATGDAGLARRALGWTPAVPWDETLDSVLADWRARVTGPG